MADYYSVLARAVVNLETGDGAAREELYERARSIIIAELRKKNPKISALTITHEQAALEAAIRRLEAELQPRPRDKDRSPHCRSEAVEADHLGEMPKVLAAMLFGPLIWRRSSPLAASSICAVWRWSTPTSFNIRSCLALWRVSDVCWSPYPERYFEGCAFTVGAPFPPDDLFEQAQFSCCSTQQLHFSGP
ncbi:MAG TPA: hypothetical protein VGH47_07230 [Xanthobacteraceae bacterium]